MQVMHLEKQLIVQNSASLSAAHAAFLSEHLTGRVTLNRNYRLLYLTSLFISLHIKLVTRLEQIVLFTFSATVQSVSYFFRCARIKLAYC